MWTGAVEGGKSDYNSVGGEGPREQKKAERSKKKGMVAAINNAVASRQRPGERGQQAGSSRQWAAACLVRVGPDVHGEEHDDDQDGGQRLHLPRARGEGAQVPRG